MAMNPPISIRYNSRPALRFEMKYVLLLSLLIIIPCASRIAAEEGDANIQEDPSSIAADIAVQDDPIQSHRSTQESLNMKAIIAHGILAAFAWSVLAPFAIASAWFRRLAPTGWIYMHVLANLLNFFFTLLAFIVAFIATNAGPSTHFSKPHHIGGLCVMILVTLQVLGGFLRPPVDTVKPVQMEDGSIEYQKDAKIMGFLTPREIWYVTHKGNGLIAFGMSIYQITSGLELFAENFGTTSALILPTYWAILGVFFVGVLVMKLILASYNDGKNGEVGLKHDPTVAFDDASQGTFDDHLERTDSDTMMDHPHLYSS